MTTDKTNIDDLFASAQDDAAISQVSINSIGAIPDYGAQIQDALGVDVNDVGSEELVIVGVLLDDSSSITFEKADGTNNVQIVRDGWNSCLEALDESKQTKTSGASKSNIIVHAAALNSGNIHPFIGIEKAPRLDGTNYDPRGGTPLHSRACVFLGTILAKAQECADNGIACRTITLIVTDGAAGYEATQAGDVKNIVNDMIRQENKHIVAGMGIDDESTDFKAMFKDMGLQDRWILTPGNTATEIRDMFQVFSRSAVGASKNAASFSQTQLGGFGQ